jgi:epoxide hydrolase-like predicted phosphatase
MVTKAIIFDCFGVLVSSARNILTDSHPEFKTQIDDLGHQSDYGLISRQQFNESLAELFDMTPEAVDIMYWGSSIRDETAINWVRQLKSSGKYKIGMLSNVGFGFFNKFFPESEQKELFDEVVLSSDVGMAKPEAMIFELTAQRLGVSPSQCIMIDDTALNIEVAGNVGMQVILCKSIVQTMSDLDRLLESDRA